jgi:hypothetical protein
LYLPTVFSPIAVFNTARIEFCRNRFQMELHFSEPWFHRIVQVLAQTFLLTFDRSLFVSHLVDSTFLLIG